MWRHHARQKYSGPFRAAAVSAQPQTGALAGVAAREATCRVPLAIGSASTTPWTAAGAPWMAWAFIQPWAGASPPPLERSALRSVIRRGDERRWPRASLWCGAAPGAAASDSPSRGASYRSVYRDPVPWSPWRGRSRRLRRFGRLREFSGAGGGRPLGDALALGVAAHRYRLSSHPPLLRGRAAPGAFAGAVTCRVPLATGSVPCARSASKRLTEVFPGSGYGAGASPP